ncbi:hypothetical protein HOY80DRAFT_977498 [Tuber brumale]|nr:hypothetical protein HOY80DRAFT_977498 [Tuber brumale]
MGKNIFMPALIVRRWGSVYFFIIVHLAQPSPAQPHFNFSTRSRFRLLIRTLDALFYSILSIAFKKNPLGRKGIIVHISWDELYITPSFHLGSSLHRAQFTDYYTIRTCTSAVLHDLDSIATTVLAL